MFQFMLSACVCVSLAPSSSPSTDTVDAQFEFACTMLEAVLARIGPVEFDRSLERVKGRQSASSCSVAGKVDSGSLTIETIPCIADFIDIEECHVTQYVTGVDDLTHLMKNDLMCAYHQEVVGGMQGAFSKCFIKNYMQAKWTSFTLGV